MFAGQPGLTHCLKSSDHTYHDIFWEAMNDDTETEMTNKSTFYLENKYVIQ